MGCPLQNLLFCHYKLFSLSSLFFFLLILSSTQMRFMAEAGRGNPKSPAGFYERVEEDHKALVRAQIGSRPPRCERRCSSCEHCEAIQVPTNPQIQNGKTNSTISGIDYARGDDSSNYKPMSWKCKCGKFIFDP